MNSRTACPFCVWHIPCCHQTPSEKASALRHHLQTTHPSQSLHRLPDNYFAQHNLHPCRRCNTSTSLYLNARALKSHHTRSHSALRTTTNSDIIVTSLRHTTAETWSQNLLWLLHLQVDPPPFTANLWRRLRPKTQQEYFATLHHVHSWVLLASVPIDHPADHPSYQTTPEPLWKLALLLDTLILHPTVPTEPPNPDKAVLQRLAALRHGNIRALHTQAFSTPAPTRTTSTAFADDDSPSPAAQALADEDNLCSA
jgi:hypothetical protein